MLLIGLVGKAKDPKALALLADALSYEPYAIALPRGDWAMQQAVNSALGADLRSSAIAGDLRPLVRRHGPRRAPVLEVMYALGRLPE